MLHEDMKKSYMNLVEAHDFAHIGSWEMDMIRDKSYWSLEAYRIYGISSEDFDGTYEGFINLIHPEDRLMADLLIKDNLNQSAFELEHRIIRPDGAVRNIKQLIKPICNKDGFVRYLHGTIQDHTGMKEFQSLLGQTEETIDRIQKRFQVLVQQSSDIFEIISPDFNILYISPAVENIIGFAPEER
ncbi:MAG: PAS domain-containing protein, partial [Bacillota bacterium]